MIIVLRGRSSRGSAGWSASLLLLGFLGVALIAAGCAGPAFASCCGFRRVKGPAPVWAASSGAYPGVLRSALAHPAIVVLLVAALLLGHLAGDRGLDSELLPEVHQGEFTVEVALPVGTPLEETESVVTPIERAILDRERATSARWS